MATQSHFKLRSIKLGIKRDEICIRPSSNSHEALELALIGENPGRKTFFVGSDLILMLEDF